MLEISQKDLPDNVPELKEMVISFIKKVDLLSNKIQFLSEELQLARLKLYSRISERFELENGEIQKSLFPEQFSEDNVSAPEDQEVRTIKEHSRKKPGRKKLPEDLERIEIIHDIPEKDKICGCGSTKDCIGEEVSEKLGIEPARLWVERHVRSKYACHSCEGVEDDGKAVAIAPVPPQMIPKSIASPSLLAHVFVSKFCDALPFYRQEKQFERYGVEISRETMVNWALKVSADLKSLREMLKMYVLSGPLINLDETTLQVLKEQGRKVSSKSYSWVARGGPPESPGILYQYDQGRSSAVVKDILGDYKGFVQTDGYSAYNFLDNHPNIEHFGCWAHARRKFNDVLKVGSDKSKGLAAEAMSMIKELYKIERLAKKNGLDPKNILFYRQKYSKPKVESFGNWLNENSRKVPPKSTLGKAFTYTLNQWPRLKNYVENGVVRMDNNWAENAIRPFVMGRKNWLFSVTPEGAEASNLFYSLIETAKANELNPFKYLKYLFEKFPHVKEPRDLFFLLPQNLSEKTFLKNLK
jgi:transposase